MYLLHLFGGAGLSDPSGPLTGRAVQRRRIALLAILALEHPRPVGRDKLVAFLWPEHDTDRARHLLRDSLYLLRSRLGEGVLLTDGDDVRLDPARVRSDVWDFEQALARDDPEAAARAYAGPLLDGFHVHGAPELGRWLDEARVRCAREHAGALERLAEAASARGDVMAAVEGWQRVADNDPYSARVAMRLMAALEDAGDRAGAIRQARIHALLLEQEFGADPDPAVQALAERMRCEPKPPAIDLRVGVPEGAGVAELLPHDGEHAPPGSEARPPGPPVRAEVDWEGGRPRGPEARRLVAAALVGIGLAGALSPVRLVPLAGAPGEGAAEAHAGVRPSVVVLPFVSLDRDPADVTFCDGLTDELIGTLSRRHTLRVAARTSAFAFKGASRDIREIARALGVGTVLEGSVRHDGSRIRVMAQLVDADDGFPLWSATYDRELTGVLSIQRELALRIADALQAELTPGR